MRPQFLQRRSRQFHAVPFAQLQNCRQTDAAIDMTVQTDQRQTSGSILDSLTFLKFITADYADITD